MSEENILPASHPITLDGKQYTLRYRAWAFIKYAEECRGDLITDFRLIGSKVQKGALNAISDSEEDSSVSVLATALIKLRDVLWAGLIEAHPTIKRDEVAKLIDFRGLNDVLGAVAAAMRLTLPDTEVDRPIEPRVEIVTSLSADGRNSGASSETLPESPPVSSAA